MVKQIAENKFPKSMAKLIEWLHMAFKFLGDAINLDLIKPGTCSCFRTNSQPKEWHNIEAKQPIMFFESR